MLLQPYRCRLSGSQTSPETMPEEIEMKIIIRGGPPRLQKS